MEPDNPKTITDLREVKHPEHKAKYEFFWEEAKLDDWHLEVTHLSTALSICDFKEQVQARCPDSTAVPCEEWLCILNCLACTTNRALSWPV